MDAYCIALDDGFFSVVSVTILVSCIKLNLIFHPLLSRSLFIILFISITRKLSVSPDNYSLFLQAE